MISTRESTPTTDSLGDRLELRLREALHAALGSPEWEAFAGPDADASFVVAVVKHILLEVYSYGAHVTEATFTAIGRMPKTRPDLMKPMILHDLEEVDHGEMALADFVKLGGDESWARSRRITPESFVMSATVRMLAERESPFAYLGYMYLFEGMTPVLTGESQRILVRHGFPVQARRFIDFHATEDIAHVRTLRRLIERAVEAYPDQAAAIEYGFDCFSAVYPLPIWRAALVRARAETKG